ncbi:MAG: hypothetical protein JW709_14375 [Sedimentisphaerales bacterium]|nr:hypothetical protein [Sedimentisphaerales bacterium]
MDCETVSKYVKFLIFLGILAFLGWWAWQGLSKISLGPPHPHPTDPAQAAKNFFLALQQPDLQACYNALSHQRKTATGVGLNLREDYFDHFQRIRRYLTHRAAPDFTANMQIEPSGRTVIFDNGVTLTLKFDTTRDNDGRARYGIAEINEFPIDVAPSLGVEARNRAMDQFIESLETGRPENQTTTSREQALINAYHDFRQLDMRHDVLESLISEFGASPATIKFLRELVQDEKQPAHLRRLAAQHLGIAY